MKSEITIGLVGHGTGGHFYPLIAVAESLNNSEQPCRLIYFGPDQYNPASLAANNIRYSWVPAGKIRNYFSILNLIDLFKFGLGNIISIGKLLYYYPDIILSKGGYAAMPVLIAAKLLRIPTLIHDSDIVPGRVTKITEKWARRVAVAWPQALKHISNEKSAVVGIPIRKSLIEASRAGGREFLRIPDEAVTILIIGGSQGAQKINQAILAGLPRLLQDFYVIHQTGKDNYDRMKIATDSLLDDSNRDKYLLFDELDAKGMARAYGATDLVVTRAGATSLFETAAVGQVPAVVVPITASVNDHQRKNAYAYKDSGAGIVIEENNLSPDLLTKTITDLITNTEKYQAMKRAAIQFSPTDSADKIAGELIQIAHEH